MTAPLKHYVFHLVNGEAIEIDADPSDVAYDGDWLVLDLSQGRMVQVARRHIVFVQVRDV